MQSVKSYENRACTTGEVARICGVSPYTVKTWIVEGELKGFKVPRSNHDRIPPKNLIEFIRENEIRVVGEKSDDDELRDMLEDPNVLYTIDHVEKICEVSRTTACKYFDRGFIKGFRIPGSLDRRMPYEHIVSFIGEHFKDDEEKVRRMMERVEDYKAKILLKRSYLLGD